MSTRQHVYPSTCLSFYLVWICLSVYLSAYPPVDQPIISICLSINLSTRRFAYLSICLFFYFSACLPVDLSIRPSINLSTRRFVYLSTYQPVYFSICLRSVYPSTTWPVYLSNHLFVNLFIRQFFTPINRPVVIYLLNYKRCSLFFIIRVYCHSLAPFFFLPENCL